MTQPGGTYAALRVPAYRTLFTVGALGFVSTQTQVIGRGWLANELSGSNAGVGGVFMAFGIPLLVATPIGGVAADRYSRTRILFLANALISATALWIALGISFDFVEYWMLLVASALQACAFSFLVPARMSMTGEVVGRDLLTNAIVLGQMTMNAARVIGPAVAGTLIAIESIGTSGVYYLSAALSGAATVRALALHEPRRPYGGRGSTSAVAEYAESLRYVWRNRQVGLLLIVSFLVVMLAFPYLAFLPRYSTDLMDSGSAGYGFLAAASAVGAVAASLYVAGRGTGQRAWRIQTLSGLGFGAAVVLFALSPNYPAAVVTVVMVGMTSSAFQAMNNSLVLALSDLEHHGRVQSMMLLSFSGFGMASLPLGALADRIGLRETLSAMGAVSIIAMLGYVRASSRARRRTGDTAAVV